MLKPGTLFDLVDGHLNAVRRLAGRNFNATALSINHEGCRPYAFEGIAELAARRAYVMALVADTDLHRALE